MSGVGHAKPSLVAQATRPRGAVRRALRSRSARGFTLVELLTVVGLIIVFVAGVGLAIAGRGGEGAALRNAQSILAGLVGTARAQAALHQTRARLVVYAQMPPQGDAAKYLRTLIVLREDPSDSGRYVATGDPVTLPAPICVVPPAPVPTNHLRTGVTWNNNAATGPVSTFTVLTGFSYRGQTSATTGQFFGQQGTSGRVLYLEFQPDGTLASNMTKIALTTAILGGNILPQFDNANTVRGLFVRKSGAVSLVHEATGF